MQACLQNAQSYISKQQSTATTDPGKELAKTAADQHDKIGSLEADVKQLNAELAIKSSALAATEQQIAGGTRSASAAQIQLLEAQQQAEKHAHEAQQLGKTVAALENQLANARQNAALAQAKPPPADDTAAQSATRLQGKMQTQQRALAEAKNRIAALEHAIESKNASRTALQDDVRVAEEAKSALVKELQGELATHYSQSKYFFKQRHCLRKLQCQPGCAYRCRKWMIHIV
jgi:chromosome segregation ATPase